MTIKDDNWFQNQHGHKLVRVVVVLKGNIQVTRFLPHWLYAKHLSIKNLSGVSMYDEAVIARDQGIIKSFSGHWASKPECIANGGLW